MYLRKNDSFIVTRREGLRNIACFLSTLFVLAPVLLNSTPSWAQVPTIPNSGFETPAVGSGNYQATPGGASWSFAGSAGVSANGSAFTAGNPVAPQGTQVAYVQTTGSFSQSVTFAAGTYSLNFRAAQRGNWGTSREDIRVFVDGAAVGTFTPAGTAYSAFTTSAFTLAAGNHTLKFEGLNTVGGDNTALIDLVSITRITVPTSGPATGYYRITPTSQTARALDVYGMANSNGATVDIWSWNGGPNQNWYVERQTDGSYKIYAYSSKNSLQMLDYASTTNGQTVLTQEDKAVNGVSDSSQRWWFTSVGSNYRIVPFAASPTGTATLQIRGGTGAGNGAAAEIGTYSNATNQRFSLTAITTPSVLVNLKKGLPAASSGVGDANMVAATGKMNCSWMYNWSINPSPNIPAGVEFVPQVWGWYGDTTITSQVLAANPGAKVVLGYNEPDFGFDAGGAQMDVTSGLIGFQYVSALKPHGFRIGGPSPALASEAWMQTFMSQVKSPTYNYNMDFIGFHNYSYDTNGASAAYNILGYLDYVHSLYPTYPIWVTEVGAANLPNTQEGLTFVKILCQGLQSRSFVERWCLFSSQVPSSSGFGASALINTDGTLTAAGKLYSRM